MMSSGGVFGQTAPVQPQKNQSGLFNFTQQPSGGLFSSSNTKLASGGQTSLFGPPQQQSGGFFGSTGSQPTSGGQSSLFGSSQPQHTGGLFGSTTAQPAATASQTSLFGSGQQPAKGLFGSTQPQTGAQTSLFGSTQSQPATQTSLFGSTQPQTGGQTSLFSSTQPQTGGQTSLFSSTQPQTGGQTSLFGSTQSQPATQTSLFGSTQPQTGGQTSLFGSTQSQPATQTSLFGSTQTGMFGSTQPQSSTQTGMFQPQSSTQTGMFGSTQPQTGSQTSLFGSTQPQTGGQTSLFGSTQPQTGGQTSLFGSTQPQTGGQTSLFSSTQPQTGGLFGSTASQPTQASIFGSSQPQTGGLFGSTAAQPVATAGQTSLFGSSQQPAKGLFGSTTTQPSAATTGGQVGLFGSSQPQTAGGLFSSSFGQPVSGTQSSIFGSTLQQPTVTFGAQQPSFGAPNQNAAAAQQAPFSSLPAGFGANLGVGFGSGLIGGDRNFSAYKTAFNSATPSGTPGIYASSPFNLAQPFASSLTQQPMSSILAAAHQQETVVPVEVESILPNLSNADSRSCQVLTDIFYRLRRLYAETPHLIAYTYEIDFDKNSLLQKESTIQQQLMELNNPAIIESYAVARHKNPDPSKYAVVPLHNLDEVVSRVQTQLQHLEHINGVLVEFKARQERIGNHLKIATTKRLDMIFKRQKYLQQSLIRVIGFLEEYAIRNSRAQVDVAYLKRLQNDVSILSDEFHNSSGGRMKLADLGNRLASLAEIVGIELSFTKPTTQKERYSQSAAESIHGSKAPTADEFTGVPATPSTEIAAPSLIEPRHPSLTLSSRDFNSIINIIRKQQEMFESLEIALQQDLSKAKRLMAVAKAQAKIEEKGSSGQHRQTEIQRLQSHQQQQQQHLSAMGSAACYQTPSTAPGAASSSTSFYTPISFQTPQTSTPAAAAAAVRSHQL